MLTMLLKGVNINNSQKTSQILKCKRIALNFLKCRNQKCGILMELDYAASRRAVGWPMPVSAQNEAGDIILHQNRLGGGSMGGDGYLV